MWEWASFPLDENLRDKALPMEMTDVNGSAAAGHCDSPVFVYAEEIRS